MNICEEIAQHPLHQQLGVTHIEGGDGNACINITANEHCLNPNGSFHGGIIYLLSDVCAYCGVSTVLPEGKHAVTNDIQVSVMRPAKHGDKVTFQSELIKMGRSLCFIEVKVTNGDKLMATAKVTKSVVG